MKTIIAENTHNDLQSVLAQAKVMQQTAALDAAQFVREGDYFVYRFQPDEDGNMH